MDGHLVGEMLAVAMFAALIVTVLFGFPIAFMLAGTGIFFAAIGSTFEVFDWRLLGNLQNRIFGIMTNETLVAIPLFVFMGVMLEKSMLAERLLVVMGRCFGTLRGGLGLAVIFVGTILAASTGIVGATVVTMGLVSLPLMLRNGYDGRLAAGTICASGTLAQIIPPSTVLILIGDQLQGANAEAQLSTGNLSFTPVTVTDLFAGALIPGLMLTGLYMLYVIFIAVTRPASCPAMPGTREERRRLWLQVITVMVPPLGLILAVLGTILFGLATPTESAAAGAVGATLLAAANRSLRLEIVRLVCFETIKLSSMIYIIMIGATIFSLVFRGLGGEALAEDILTRIGGGAAGAVLIVLLLMFVLGFFIDTFEIIFIVVPIFAPVLLKLGVDPVWLGVMMGLNLQTSYLTPPVGFALFYLQGVARELPVSAIYFGVIPFVLLQIVGMALVWAFPAAATWLPKLL
jgi:tripartite ATP-independent transporter DctM subunit